MGQSIQVQLASAGMVVDPDALLLDGKPMGPDAIDRLRRYNRFIPSEMLLQLERTTGQDIDGDGRIGGVDPTPAGVYRQRDAAPRDHALRTASSQGPFVQNRTASLLTSVVIAVAVVALGLWIVLETLRP